MIFIEDVVDCPDQLTGVVFHDKCQKNTAGKSAVYDGEGDEKKYRSFGKRWKGLNSASNYKRQQFVICISPLSVIKCEQDFLAP